MYILLVTLFSLAHAAHNCQANYNLTSCLHGTSGKHCFWCQTIDSNQCLNIQCKDFFNIVEDNCGDGFSTIASTWSGCANPEPCGVGITSIVILLVIVVFILILALAYVLCIRSRHRNYEPITAAMDRQAHMSMTGYAREPMSVPKEVLAGWGDAKIVS